MRHRVNFWSFPDRSCPPTEGRFETRNSPPWKAKNARCHGSLRCPTLNLIISTSRCAFHPMSLRNIRIRRVSSNPQHGKVPFITSPYKNGQSFFIVSPYKWDFAVISHFVLTPTHHSNVPPIRTVLWVEIVFISQKIGVSPYTCDNMQ